MTARPVARYEELPRAWYDFRGAIKSDQPYVGATWTRSMLVPHITERAAGLRTWPEISAAIDRTMDRPETRVLVCCARHDRRSILGWCCFADAGALVVHYLYVRETMDFQAGWRALRSNAALGAQLLEQIGVRPTTPVVCTSIGPSSRDMRERYPASSHLPLTEYLNPGART